MPLTYVELSRPNDLLKAGLNLVIGMFFFIKKGIFNNLYSSIFIFITFLIIFYLVEIFSIRWNQLSDKEKNKLKTVVELKKNVSILMDAISLAFKDFLNSRNILKLGGSYENLNNKKWVRNDENANISPSNKNKLLSFEMSKKATIQPKKDTINEEKNN